MGWAGRVKLCLDQVRSMHSERSPATVERLPLLFYKRCSGLDKRNEIPLHVRWLQIIAESVLKIIIRDVRDGTSTGDLVWSIEKEVLNRPRVRWLLVPKRLRTMA